MTADEFAVEPATIDDLDALVTLWVDLVESQEDFGSHILGSENRSKGRDVLAQYISGDMIAVARPTGEQTAPERPPLLGFVMFHMEEGLYDQRVPRGIVENLYVVPAARESGVGSALMDYAESALQDRGGEVVALSVMAANETGRDFYEARGYERHRVVYERELSDADPIEETGE